ncbi:hypothetical protein [Haladaptatus sp. NG-SE-30]
MVKKANYDDCFTKPTMNHPSGNYDSLTEFLRDTFSERDLGFLVALCIGSSIYFYQAYGMGLIAIPAVIAVAVTVELGIYTILQPHLSKAHQYKPEGSHEKTQQSTPITEQIQQNWLLPGSLIGIILGWTWLLWVFFRTPTNPNPGISVGQIIFEIKIASMGLIALGIVLLSGEGLLSSYDVD